MRISATLATVAAAALLVAGCGASASEPASSRASSPAPKRPGLVGRWERVSGGGWC